MGFDGSRQRKWRLCDVLAESRLVGGRPFSLPVGGGNIRLSHTILRSIEVSSDTACLIEYEEIRRFPCQFRDQSAGTFFGRQHKLNNPVSLNLFDLVDARTLQMGAEELAKGWRCRWILKGRSHDMESGGIGVA